MSFRWDATSYEIAGLSANKANQTRNHCEKELIPKLNQRRGWARCVRAFNPDLPEIMLPELQTEHFFIYVARHFVLRYEQRGQWRLHFIGHVEDGDEPRQDGDRQVLEMEAEAPPRAAACANPQQRRRRAVRRMRLEDAEAFAVLIFNVIEPRLARIVRALRFRFRRSAALVRAALRRLSGQQTRTAASLSQIVRRSAHAIGAAPRPAAYLERRRVEIAPGLVMDFYSLSGVTDWGADLFGRRDEQALA